MFQPIPADTEQPEGSPLFTPSASNKPDPDKKSNKRSLAEVRGKNWALGDPGAKATPVTRPIRVRCEGERLIVSTDPAGGDERVITLSGRTENSVDQLVSVVRGAMKDWGIAGKNMYWKPLLVLELGPSGEGRLADVQALLANSGFDVKRK